MLAPDPFLPLIRLISQGNEKAFVDLYEAFKTRVYNTALSYLQNAAEAEEATQDVFIKIHQSATRFEGKSSVSTWIYRITVNQSIDKINYRNRQKRAAVLINLFRRDGSELQVEKPHFEHPGVLLENKEKAKILFKAIESLSEQQKTAFILSFVEELPRQEVADIMQLSLKAVESLLQRAKSNLRLRLEDFYPGRRI